MDGWIYSTLPSARTPKIRVLENKLELERECRVVLYLQQYLAGRPKSALHQVSYRWNHHFTDDAGGLAIPATIDTTSSVEHLFHHRRRWNYYSSDNRHRLISGATIPATLTLD